MGGDEILENFSEDKTEDNSFISYVKQIKYFYDSLSRISKC